MNCPMCNTPGAYVGLFAVECSSTTCKHFVAPKVKVEGPGAFDDSKKWAARAAEEYSKLPVNINGEKVSLLAAGPFKKILVERFHTDFRDYIDYLTKSAFITSATTLELDRLAGLYGESNEAIPPLRYTKEYYRRHALDGLVKGHPKEILSYEPGVRAVVRRPIGGVVHVGVEMLPPAPIRFHKMYAGDLMATPRLRALCAVSREYGYWYQYHIRDVSIPNFDECMESQR